MEIGEQLKRARNQAELTQEQVADEIHVSRQTISNWENQKSYPDIASVILLSDLYGLSLDALLKGDDRMVQHLEASTDIVRSNKYLLMAFLLNILFLILLMVFAIPISENQHLTVILLAVVTLTTGVLFYQLIRKI